MTSPFPRVLGMLNGYQQTCVIVAAKQLGVFDALAAEGATADELAARIGARPDALERLLRGLHVLDLIAPKGDQLRLTDAGELLASSDLGSLAVLIGEEYLSTWGALGESVRTGEVAFDKMFGVSVWQHREQHRHVGEAFNVITSSMQRMATRAVTAAYDMSAAKRIVDVGGGFGHLLAGALDIAKQATGVLFDLPHVIERARTELSARGLADRVELVPGSFLETVPAGGDLYLLKHCLHNWSDEDAATILAHCRAAMPANAVLLVLEDILPTTIAPDATPTVMLDLHMLAVLGGRERTVAQYEALLSRSGLRLVRSIATGPGAPDILHVVRP